MLVIGEQTHGTLALSFLVEKTRQFMVGQVPSFAALPREDQREWVAMAFSDAKGFDLESERAPAAILLVLWSLGISTVNERPDLAAVLAAPGPSETKKLDDFAERARATIAKAGRP